MVRLTVYDTGRAHRWVVFNMPNQLTRQSANDFVHLTRHLRHAYTEDMRIKASTHRDVSMNPLVCKRLYPLHVKRLSVYTTSSPGIGSLPAVEQLRGAFSDGFIQTHRLWCCVDPFSDNSPAMSELLLFISRGRASPSIQQLKIEVENNLDDESKKTILDTIIRVGEGHVNE